MHSNSNDCWRRSRLYYYATTLVLDTPPLYPSYLPVLGMTRKRKRIREGSWGCCTMYWRKGQYIEYTCTHTLTHTHSIHVCYIYSQHTALSQSLAHYCVYFSSPPSSSPSCSLIQSVRLSLSNCMISVLSL